MAAQVVLDGGQRQVDGAHRALELGIARARRRLVHDHAVDPGQFVLFVEDAAPGLGHPARAAVAVQQAVVGVVSLAPRQRMRHRSLQPVAVLGVDEPVPAREAIGEILLGPARQLLDGAAEQQRRPFAVVQAAERGAGHVVDQGAVLLLAAAQRLQHLAALADIGHKAHVQRIAGNRHPPHGQAHGDLRAVLVHGVDIAAGAQQARKARGQMLLQRAAIAIAARRGHEQACAAAHHLLRRPAQQPLGRAVERHDAAAPVDHHDAVHCRLHHGAQARFAALHLAVDLAVAQRHVDREHQTEDQHHHADDGEHQQRVRGRLHLRQHIDLGLEAQCIQARIVHAGNGQAHDDAGHQRGPQPARVAQPEAHPQRQHGHACRHDHRQQHAPGVVEHRGPGLGRRHADVVHGANAQPHEHAAAHQRLRGQLRPHHQRQRQPGRQHAGQHGQRGDPGVVVAKGAGHEGQHADEVHGPDARAQAEGAREHAHAAYARRRGIARQPGNLHGHHRRGHGHQHRQRHQARMQPLEPLRMRRPAEHENLVPAHGAPPAWHKAAARNRRPSIVFITLMIIFDWP